MAKSSLVFLGKRPGSCSPAIALNPLAVGEYHLPALELRSQALLLLASLCSPILSLPEPQELQT